VQIQRTPIRIASRQRGAFTDQDFESEADSPPLAITDYFTNRLAKVFTMCEKYKKR
jgi:hypothetical protein